MRKEERETYGERLLEKCWNLLRSEGIPVSGSISGLVINDRIRSRFGSCRKVKNAKTGFTAFEIELSGKIMESSEKSIETVILHELLHTCRGCMNHGAKWKAYAEKINAKYGYEIRPSARYESFGLEEPESKEEYKYRIVCTGCGMEIRRKRRCRIVEKTDMYRCGKCGGRLEIR